MPIGEKFPVNPEMKIRHDKEKYVIDIKLPGVSKEDINLHINEESLCLTAPRKDVELSGCQSLAHKVVPEKAEAEFEEGRLRIELPLAKSPEGKKIEIE